jgi:biotin transport system ATP-binding protein
MESAAIIVKSLSFSYEDGKPLIDNLTFELPGGTLLSVLGANGTGKSTLLDLLAGIREPLSGTVEIAGNMASSVERKLSLLPQNIDYFLLGQNVLEEIELSVRKLKDTKESAATLASAWGLEGKLDDYVENLSGGEKKRLALIGALASRPLALFLDEPFSGLDWPGTKTLLGDLVSLKAQGLTIVLVSHEPSLLLDLSDYFLLLSRDKGPYFTSDQEELKERLELYGVRPIA